jgi:TPP-dependent pyruvate/acetoin dehydrogenase alpha subunit
MKRYPAFDPPEYVAWTRDDRDVEDFRQRLRADPARGAVIDHLTDEHRLGLYRGLVRTRLTDIALKRWVRQGVISKAWLGTGEEGAGACTEKGRTGRTGRTGRHRTLRSPCSPCSP